MPIEDIPGLRVETIEPVHEDERRAIISVFNNLPLEDLPGFSAAQLKIADIHQDLPLGGHYHSYDELFYLLKGDALFVVEQIDTKKRFGFELPPGGRVFIPARVAHRIDHISAGAVLIGCTTAPYVSGDNNDKKYDFGD